jgi:hypothetical protein
MLSTQNHKKPLFYFHIPLKQTINASGMFKIFVKQVYISKANKIYFAQAEKQAGMARQ